MFPPKILTFLWCAIAWLKHHLNFICYCVIHVFDTISGLDRTPNTYKLCSLTLHTSFKHIFKENILLSNFILRHDICPLSPRSVRVNLILQTSMVILKGQRSGCVT